MKLFLSSYFLNVIVMSVISLLFILLTKVNQNRKNNFKASTVYYSWIMIAVGFLMPFRYPVTVVQESYNPQVTPQIINNMMPNNPDPFQFVAEQTGFTFTKDTLLYIILFIWIVVATIILFQQLYIHKRFTSYLKRWRKPTINTKTIAIYNQLKTDLKINKEILLYQCSGISSPMLVGVFNPIIVLPIGAESFYNIESILKHELIHYKRKDILIRILLLIAGALNWYNPIFIIARKQIDLYCEISCDQLALENVSLPERKEYCKEIISTALIQPQKTTYLSTNFNGGPKEMKQRITSIINTDKKRTGVFLLSLTLVVTLLVGYLFPINVNAKQDVSTNIINSTTSNTSFAYGSKTIANPSFLRQAAIAEDFTFITREGKLTNQDLSKIELFDHRIDEWVPVSNLKVYEMTNLKEKDDLDSWNLIAIPSSVNTDEKLQQYVNLAVYDTTPAQMKEVTNPQRKASFLQYEIRVSAGSSPTFEKVKVNGKKYIAPDHSDFDDKITSQDSNQYYSLVDLLSLESSTLYASYGFAENSGIFDIYATDLEKFKDSEAMKIIKANNWDVVIHKVDYSMKELSDSIKKLENSADKLKITTVDINPYNNGLMVGTTDDSVANKKAIKDLANVDNILVYLDNTKSEKS